MSSPKSLEETKVETKDLPELTIEDYELGYEEFFRLSRKLEVHHAVFYQLWELGRPVFTNSIPTAAVRFNKEGHCIEFVFNLHFWKSLNDDQRVFVISHECLHVILKHGLRFKDSENPHACNVAMDVVVNELLLEQFGFDQKKIDPEGKYCWMNTVFKKVDPSATVADGVMKMSGDAFKKMMGIGGSSDDATDSDNKSGQAAYGEVRDDIEYNQNYEYYYNRLPESAKQPGKWILVDIHDFMDGAESEEAIYRLNESLTNEDKESLKKMIEKHLERKKKEKEEKEDKERGTETAGQWRFMDKARVPEKRKWETVIRRWAEKYLKSDFDYFEHWARANRRLLEMPEDVVLPTEMELQDKEEDGRVLVYFFLDTSGSCAHLADRFWKAAKTLPKRRFDKRLFCFDTSVYKVDEKEGKLYGFGGTSFDIIEQEIQKEIKAETNPKRKGKYPHAVFVITDGYGNNVTPAKPKNWHIFFTEHYSDSCFPPEVHKYKLADYE